MTNSTSRRHALPVHRDHRRDFADNLYVYAVVSRRSKGVSIGLNLNPDKVCNFDCVYCQVDRKTPPVVRDVDQARLIDELDDMLDRVQSGELFNHPRFQDTPQALHRLNDIAFSGDGEPTTCPDFKQIVEQVAALKSRRKLADAKLVVITNATRLHHPLVREALEILDRNQGEIWAKLEAGTEGYYRLVERTTIPFHKVLDNISLAAKARPLVIQSLFLKMHGEPPPRAELEAFCDRLNEIVAAGGKIRLVQVYTVARVPAEAFAQPLADEQVDAISALVTRKTGVLAESYYGYG